MDQEGKKRFSFASVAISFFILIVLPLSITGIIISRGVVKVGEEATQANLRILDENQKQSIEGRAKTVAEAVAQFLDEREKDIRIASILPRNETAYSTFLASNTRGVIQVSDMGIVKVPRSIYREIAFLGKNGKEVIRVTVDGVVKPQNLRDMSKPENGEYGYEDYFSKARSMAPGDFYFGPVVGYHVNKAEFEAEKNFNGLIRMAAPVFDSTGFAGVVELSLNFIHIMEFTDHIVPTEAGMTYARVDLSEGNYVYMVDREGFVISHPLDYFIKGLSKNKVPLPVVDESSYKKYLETGNGIINVAQMGFVDENLPRIHALASEGKLGSFTYALETSRIFVAYAPIPYYGDGFSKPQGFGWIGMTVDIDKYRQLSQAKVEEIQQKVARWQKSSIMVVIVSLILLFAIALILSRGIYRAISSTQYENEIPPVSDDED